ncbi:DUF4062 domain-containing protein [Saccharospirillum salsuginis]|uniref:DUF4062 domain-containing protein n=1 Tax=Saccharospirillum salsuginis TaxID=418750 RepID=A0A918KE42_9GAMM|nr:DUF4062 domain-containing protein [Saccharospirillum salsuginis]GGX59962.1 hypothetical protein GCM10007392_29940 [Saccharospirillum salsuginis]
MSDTKPLIMVASLDRHLQKERSALFEALMAQGCIPTGLPFPAVAANYLWKLNQIAINDADYVFLLIGREYGPLSEKGVGYLHQTYAAARAAHKTVVSFIYTGDEKPVLSEIDQTRLTELIAQAKTGINYEWDSEETLRDKAELAVEYVLETYPQPGWCRALDEPHENRELEALREQVAQLKREMEKDRADTIADLSLLHDPKSVWKTRFNCKAFREGQLKVLSGELSVPWKTVFGWLAAPLLTPIPENKVFTLLSEYMQPLALQDIKRRWRGSHAVADVKPDRASFDQLKLQLRGTELIRFDDQGRWRLTEAGESVAMHNTTLLSSTHQV